MLLGASTAIRFPTSTEAEAVPSVIFDRLEEERIPFPYQVDRTVYGVAPVLEGDELIGAMVVQQELKQELEKRVNRGVGRVDKGAPRILFSMTSFDPAITEMVEKLGLAISTTALSPPVTAPIAGTAFGSVWEEIADNILRRRGTQYSSMATINQYAGLAKHYDVDGAILFHHIGCRQYCNWIPQGKVQIEKDLAIPVLALEGDFIDSREYSVNQMQNRVEAFSEVVKSTANRRRERGS